MRNLSPCFAVILMGFCFLFSVQIADAQQVSRIRWDKLQSILEERTDSITVMNFWATWCKPCVAELPHFEKVRKDYQHQPVRFIYVSLDFASELENRLLPFAKKKLPGARVFLLDETDYNQWIGKLHPDWSGSIPATLVFQNNRKNFIFADSEIGEEKLRSMIQSVSVTSKSN